MKETTFLKDQIRKLEDRLIELGEFENAPCFICGYNGDGYYQPDKHKCAKRYHKIFKE